MAILLRAYLYYDVRPTEFWTSNLEFDYDGTLEGGIVEDAALAMAAGLAELCLTNVVIDRIVASTWESDSAPYDPESVRTIPIGINGERSFLATSPVDDDLTLFIRKVVATGRSGKIMLRGCLTIADLNSSSGAWTLDGTATSYFETAVAAYYDLIKVVGTVCSLVGKSLLEIFYPATPEGTKQIPERIYEEAPTIRPVTGFVMVGPAERQDTQ